MSETIDQPKPNAPDVAPSSALPPEEIDRLTTRSSPP